MPSFSFSNPLSGRRVASAQDGGLPRPGNGGKGHRSKISTTPAITGSSSHRPERPGLVPERHSSNTTGFPRPSISASSSTQDVRLASFNNTSQTTNAAGSGMRNVAGLKGEQKVIAVLINRLVSKVRNINQAKALYDGQSDIPPEFLIYHIQNSYRQQQVPVLGPRREIRSYSKRLQLWKRFQRPSLLWLLLV